MMVTIDDFAKIEMRVGLVTEAINKEGSEKLICLTVDMGDRVDRDDRDIRIIFTGVRQWYKPKYFLNKKFLFVTNLEPKRIMEEESQGMILAAGEGKPIFLEVSKKVEVGARVR